MSTGSLKTASAAMLSAAALIGMAGAASGQTVLKLGHVYETEHPMHIGAVAGAEYFAGCTGGAYAIEVFPASQLGKETALNEQIRFGGVDIFFTGQIFASNAYPALAVGAAPYIFRDRDHALAYLKSEVFRDLTEGWGEATGQHMLGGGYFGAFHVGSNGKPIVTVEDIQDMKIRVPDSPFFMAFPRAAGANPTPIAFSEVYLALQQGVVQGTVNPLPVIYAKKFYEVLDYVALTNHLIEYVIWIVGDHVWQTLSEAEKTCMREASVVYGDTATNMVVDQENSLRELMTNNGWLEFTDPDTDAFMEITAAVIQEGIDEGKWTQEIVDRIRAIE